MYKEPKGPGGTAPPESSSGGLLPPWESFNSTFIHCKQKPNVTYYLNITKYITPL